MSVAQPVANSVDQTDYNSARSTYNAAASAALPSQASLDNAAARVRARLAGQAAGQRKTLNQQMAGRGVSNSGINRAANQAQAYSEQSSLGTALSDLQSEWWDKQQTGAGILNDTAAGMNALGTNYNNALAQNQSIANTWQQGQDTLTEEKRKNSYDTLLGLSSILGQYGNLSLTGYKKNQWEKVLSTLAGVAGWEEGVNDVNIDLTKTLPSQYWDSLNYTGKFSGDSADWKSLMSGLSPQIQSQNPELWAKLLQIGQENF